MIINTTSIKTPIGQLTIGECDGFIVQCQYTENRARYDKDSLLLKLAHEQLNEYFSGQRTEFNLPLAPAGTPFQQKVWNALQTIPYGEQWSYQKLAHNLGNSKAARAVGSANAKNPICIIIPCHRVIRGSGSPGKYAGGEDIKTYLLDLEKRKESITIV